MVMNSRERIFAAWNGTPADHVPLTTWCFGLPVPPHLRWRRGTEEIQYWYSLRMEHIHTLPQTWTLEDDFQRALAWLSLGIDDLLDVSVPWSSDPTVTFQDRQLQPFGEVRYPILERRYQTPAGELVHAVRQTGEDPGPGWVIQPGWVPLFEDYNIPRGLKHAVNSPGDILSLAYLYQTPDEVAQAWFSGRMAQVKRFADQHNVAVQAWSAFGMDGVVWLTGSEGAILMALEQPEAFGRLVEIVAQVDYGRTELAASTPGVDLIVERGWYSSTDFWSPRLFEIYVLPQITELAALTHRYGKKFAYTMTTGVERLGPLLAEAGVDVLYFIDPIQDKISLELARELLGERMTLVGGINALSLAAADPQRIRSEVFRAIEVLAPTERFILHPIDAVFPDTPWSSIQALIAAWKEAQAIP